jgi:hypothetical protein
MNRAWTIVAILLVVLVAMWLLKVAVKLIFIGLVVVAAIAAYQAIRDRIGGPRAR